MAIEELNEEAIFNLARKIDSAELRQAYLQQACGASEELRGRVGALLEIHEGEREFLAVPCAAISVIDSTSIEDLGTLIGPYKLLEQIGEGGFGLVFVAEQLQPVRRKVAVKVLKPGMDTRQVIARFEAERQALALMDHPHIAKVLEAGATASGRPYFAMELVRGIPITDYCDKNSLTPRERLKLFLTVCQAVQHAHHKAIIHRDLKPSNILAALHDGEPVVKVIDFGIAKALGQQLTDKTLYTGVAQMIGTPLYMSPEQAEMSGLDVDTRSDIYSLGVLLYELLTGTTPFDNARLSKVGYAEMRRVIREEEPAKPSTRLSTMGEAATVVSARRQSDPKRLSQLFRGELDWIVMKALEKERGRRYQTANDLARDIERYLHDQPVSACPPSAWYRYRKFARRNRRALTMAGVVTAAFVLVLVAVAGSIGWIASDRAAREAALEGEVNRAVDEAGNLIHDAKWPEALARVQRAQEVLAAAGRQQLPERLEEIQRDLTMAQRLEDIYSQPKNHDFFTGKEQDMQYADAFKIYGIDVAVLPVAEAAERIRARSIRAQLVLALDLWANMRYRAGTPVAGWQRLLEIAQAADEDRWRRQMREACRRGDREAVAALAEAADLPRMPAASLYLLARTCSDFLQDTERAIAVLRQAQRQYPGDLWLNDNLAWAYLSARPPHYDEAIRFYSVALALRPNNPYFICLIGTAMLGKGSCPEAIAELSRAIALKPDYLDALCSRGDAYLKTGAGDQALADFSRLIDLQPKAALAWNFRGLARDHLKQWDLAIADYSQAIDLDRKDASSWRNRGHARAQLHEWDGALADFSVALKLDPKLALTWMQRGEVFVDMRQWAKAGADFDKLLELAPHEPMNWFANACLRLQGGDDEGYRKLCRLMLDRFGQSKDVAEIGVLAHAWTLAPQAPGDGARVRQLAQLRMDLTPPRSAYRPWSFHVLGLAYYRTGQNDKAVALLQQGVRDNPDSDRNALNFLVLAMAHHRLMHTAEAGKCLAKARELLKQEARPEPNSGFISPGRPWLDRLCVQMLQREAEALLASCP